MTHAVPWRELQAIRQVAGHHARIIAVVGAPGIVADDCSGTVCNSQFDQFGTNALDYISDQAGGCENHPGVATIQQEARQQTDQVTRLPAAVAGEVANFDDLRALYWSGELCCQHGLDGLVQILLKEKPFLLCGSVAGDRPQFATDIAHAEQIGHEGTDLRAMLVPEGGSDKALKFATGRYATGHLLEDKTG